MQDFVGCSCISLVFAAFQELTEREIHFPSGKPCAAKPRVSFWDAALERSLKAFLVKFLSRKKLYIIEMENAKHFTY